ncbi:hypothetical protein AVEN_148612-1, partial [Araneus ventricosus]
MLLSYWLSELTIAPGTGTNAFSHLNVTLSQNRSASALDSTSYPISVTSHIA